MNFNNNVTLPNQVNQQPTNNFIDLTDLNIGNQSTQIPQTNFIVEQPNQQQEPINNMQQPIISNITVDNQPMVQPTMNDVNNILNLGELYAYCY